MPFYSRLENDSIFSKIVKSRFDASVDLRKIPADQQHPAVIVIAYRI